MVRALWNYQIPLSLPVQQVICLFLLLTSLQSKREKKDRQDEVDEAILKSLNQMEEGRTQRRKEDEEDFFEKHVAAVLRRLPDRARAIARLHIEQVLLEAEFPDPDASRMTFPTCSNYTY